MKEIVEGLVLGIAVNWGCVMVCAPVILPYFISDNIKPLRPVLKFLSGRLIAYVFFAIASGTLGIYFSGRIKPSVFAVFEIMLSFWLILYSLGKMTEKISFCGFVGKKFSGKNFPFFAGIVLGLNICPPFLLGLERTMSMNSIIKPVLFFLGFYLGSSLWVIGLLFSEFIAAKAFVRVSGRILAVAAGLWYFVDGIKILTE